MKISDKGKDFKGNKLVSAEDDLGSIGYLLWKGRLYQRGNTYHWLVELHDLDGKGFIRTVKVKNVRLVK